jgi:hypothetical protein
LLTRIARSARFCEKRTEGSLLTVRPEQAKTIVSVFCQNAADESPAYIGFLTSVRSILSKKTDF